jgi:hypothetical protein
MICWNHKDDWVVSFRTSTDDCGGAIQLPARTAPFDQESMVILFQFRARSPASQLSRCIVADTSLSTKVCLLSLTSALSATFSKEPLRGVFPLHRVLLFLSEAGPEKQTVLATRIGMRLQSPVLKDIRDFQRAYRGGARAGESREPSVQAMLQPSDGSRSCAPAWGPLCSGPALKH